MKLELLLDNESQFTDLVRITDFTSVKECLDIVNKYFISPHQLAEAHPDDLFYSEHPDGKNYKYLYVAGDGEVSFVEDLNEFSEDYQSEQEWGVVSSKEIY